MKFENWKGAPNLFLFLSGEFLGICKSSVFEKIKLLNFPQQSYAKSTCRRKGSQKTLSMLEIISGKKYQDCLTGQYAMVSAFLRFFGQKKPG